MMGSSPSGVTVAVADMAMHRIVVPKYVGSNPTGHIWMNKDFGNQVLPFILKVHNAGMV